MITYFDSSALVKLLIREPGSDVARDLWDATDAAVSSRVANAEVAAALAAAERVGRLTSAQHVESQAAWTAMHASLRLVELDADVEQAAGHVARQHALSGFDAIHLASAMVLGPDETVLATWDRRLAAGAGAEGMSVAPAPD